jgi:hypothetical protein
MKETKNLENILAELEYLNTSVLAKLENLNEKGVVDKFEKLLKKIENSEYILEKLNETSLILKVVYYAVLADKNLVANVVKIAKKFNDDEIVEFLTN